MTRREFVIATLLASTALTTARSAEAMLFRGGAAAASAIQQGTLTLANTSGSAQASGFVTPIFSWIFTQGAVPAGGAPQFLISGTPQPYSWGMQSYWPDGSLLRASFMLRCGAAVAGNGTLAIGVWNGGTAPAASARTLGEVWANGISVNLTGITPAGGNLSGSWGAWLSNSGNTAAGSNNVRQSLVMDGAAGRVWEMEVDCSAAQGGAAHGQLSSLHWVQSLTDGSGNLAGFRHLYRLEQPWWDLNSPAKNWRAFTGLSVSWTGGGGGTITAPWPFTTAALTWTSGALTVGSNNYYTGAADPHDGYFARNVIPGYLTGISGVTGVDGNTLYFLTINSSNSFALLSASTRATNGNGGVGGLGTGSGTAAFNPCQVCLSLGSTWGANNQGKYNFFQGSGSFAGDCTIRTEFDQTYWRSVGVLPFDTSLNGTINDSTWGASYLYSSITIGPVVADRGDYGNATNQGIGYINPDAGRYFYNQSAVGELTVRTLGYCGNYELNCFRTSTSRQYPNLSNTTYSGMDAPSSTQQNLSWVSSSGAPFNFTAPPANNLSFTWIQANPTHKPSYAFPAFLYWGEPQFLRSLIEETQGDALTFSGGGHNNRNPTTPSSAAGFGFVTTFYGSGESRPLGWSLRDLAAVAAFIPQPFWDGSSLGQYFFDRLAGSTKFAAAQLANNQNAYCQSVGMWMPSGQPLSPNPGDFVQRSPFQLSYQMTGYYLAYLTKADANALACLKNEATWRNHVLNNFGGWLLYSEYDHSISITNSANLSLFQIKDDAHWAPCIPALLHSISWVASSPTFTLTLVAGNGYVPTNGDKYIFDSGETLPGNIVGDAPYIALNVSGSTIQLSPMTTSNVWVASAAYGPGDIILPPSGVNAGGYVYCCTTAAGGTSGSTQPTWPQSVGATVADNGLTWQSLGIPGTAVAPTTSGSVISGSGPAFNGSGPWLVPAFAQPASNGYALQLTSDMTPGPQTYLDLSWGTTKMMNQIAGFVDNNGVDLSGLLNDGVTRWNWWVTHAGTSHAADPSWAFG